MCQFALGGFCSTIAHTATILQKTFAVFCGTSHFDLGAMLWSWSGCAIVWTEPIQNTNLSSKGVAKVTPPCLTSSLDVIIYPHYGGLASLL